MRFAVVGVGAVGGYFGGRLAEAGLPVTFVTRGETLATLRHEGLRVDSPAGDLSLYPVEATDSPAEIGHVDAVLLCVKAWQVPRVAPMLAPMLGAESLVVPLQNGIEAPEQLAVVLGSGHVAGAMCRIAAWQEAPGHIMHVGVEPTIIAGELNNRRTPRIIRLVESLGASGIRAECPPDIHVAMWKKLLFIAPVSGVAAVTRASLPEMRSLPETRALMKQGMEEVHAAAGARGVDLGDDAIAKTLAFLDSMPPGSSPSMQRDMLERRPSELEAIVGGVVRQGRATGTPTPLHDFLYAALLPQERSARAHHHPPNG